MTRRKPLNRAREKPSDSSSSQMDESSHTSYDRRLSSAGDGVRAVGKRKVSFFQLDRVCRDESKGNQSYQNKTCDGKSIFRRETRASTKQKAKGVVDIQSSYMGLNKEKGLFVFGANLSPPKEAGPVHSLGYVSQTTWTDLKPGIRNKVRDSKTLNFIKHGENREVGVVLQGQNSPNRGRDDQVDQAGPNGDLGVVRLGADASMEKFISVDGGKQSAGLPSIDEHGLGVDPESMVEVCNRQPNCSATSTTKLNLVRAKFRGAALGKIVDRDREIRDGNGDFNEEDSHRQACGMLYDGEFEQGEDDTKCRSQDTRYHSHQNVSKGEGHSSPLGHSIPGEVGEQGRGDGSMEIENH